MLTIKHYSSSAISGMYRDQELFLISDKVPEDYVKRMPFENRGVCFATYNKGIHSFHPHLWICDEHPDENDLNFWLDPSIVKFVPQGHLEMVLAELTPSKEKYLHVQDCPAVLSYEENPEESQLLEKSKLDAADSLPSLAILALIKKLGFKSVIWLSCITTLERKDNIAARRYTLTPTVVSETESWEEAIESRSQEFSRLDTQGMYDRAQQERDLDKAKAQSIIQKSQSTPRVLSPTEVHLEIVSHCWRYSTLLTFQLSSLVLAPPKARVTMTVYYAEEDEKTAEVLKYFTSQFPKNITSNWQALPKEKLFRRAIGRNHASLNSQADWIWFTDCDYIFRENFLDKLCIELVNRSPALSYPRFAMRVPDELTENLINDVKEAMPSILAIPKEYGIPQYFNRAIGGLQIVRGDIAREIGYLKNHRRMQKPAPHWMKTVDDVRFRKSLKIAGVPIELPGLVRMGHATKGRSNTEVAN